MTPACLPPLPLSSFLSSENPGAGRWRRRVRRFAFPALGVLAVLVLVFWVNNLEHLMQRPSVAGGTTSEELLRRADAQSAEPCCVIVALRCCADYLLCLFAPMTSVTKRRMSWSFYLAA